MIPSVLLAAWLAGPAVAQDEGSSTESTSSEPTTPEEDPLSRHRTDFDALTEQSIGTTSVPVQFNWRRTTVHVAGTGSFLFELNNFDSARVGGLLRIPAKTTLFELGVNYAHVWNTPSSELLALTPYRQPGRPRRLELDVGLALPVAEGVITTFPRFFPAVQMSFDLYGALRYSVYPTGFGGMKPGKVFTALLSPTLTEDELANLDEARLEAMQIDPGRYGLMLGFGNDIYFKQGLFVSPRVMFAVPLLAPASGTELYFWADFSLAVGWAF